MTFKYKTGVVMTEQPYLEDNPGAQGIKFIGTKGWIEVARGYIACSDASLIPAEIAGNRPQPRTERPSRSAGTDDPLTLRDVRLPLRYKVRLVRLPHRQDCSLRSVHLTCRISLIPCVHARNRSHPLRSAAVQQ